MKISQFVSGSLLLAFSLSACKTTPIRTADEWKNKAAADVGHSTGVDTLWNTVTPCAVGQMFHVAASSSGHTLKPYFDFSSFLPQNLILIKEPNMPFDFTVSGNNSVTLTLNYLGLTAKASNTNTKKITFESKTDKYFYFTNSPGFDQALHTSIGDITRDLLRKQERALLENPKALPKYWVVTEMLNMKSASIALEKSGRYNYGLTTSDVGKVANSLVVPVNTNVPTGSLVVDGDSTTNASISTNVPFTLTAVLRPIRIEPNGRIYVDYDRQTLKQVGSIKLK